MLLVGQPTRGVDIGATAIQLFTKQANQWKERLCDAAEVEAFRAALEHEDAFRQELLLAALLVPLALLLPVLALMSWVFFA